MRIIQKGRKSGMNPLHIYGTYECMMCKAIFEVNLESDFQSIRPKSSWSGPELGNHVGVVEGTCPECKQRSDLSIITTER